MRTPTRLRDLRAPLLTRRTARLLVGASATLVIGAALAAAPADAAPVTPGAPSTPSTQALRAAVQHGTLTDGRSTRRTCPRCDGLVVTTSATDPAPLQTGAPVGNGPADLAAAYHLPPGSAGAATTIAIIDAGVDPALQGDLATYRGTYGLPSCTTANGCLQLIDYRGGSQPAPPTDDFGRYTNELVATETSLDMDAASAACPSCHLMEISVPWQDAVTDNDVSTDDFAHAVDLAVSRGAKVISISYGYTTDLHNSSGAPRKSFDRPGVAIVASTGDNGFNGGDHQQWPSALPTVVAAGGTTLMGDGSQTAWFGAGSGCETRFAAAQGQPADIAALCAGHRAAADISADADPSTGLAVYDTYAPYSNDPPGWTVIGGTSASAPFIAGLFARVGDLAAVDGPSTLYSAPRSRLTDVKRGSIGGRNCHDYHGVSGRLCHAGSGWDGPTGLGTPNGLGAFNPSAYLTTEN